MCASKDIHTLTPKNDMFLDQSFQVVHLLGSYQRLDRYENQTMKYIYLLIFALTDVKKYKIGNSDDLPLA